MDTNEAFKEMAAALAKHGFLAELIYTMKRTARVSLALGERTLGVIFEDLSQMTDQALAEVLEVMAGRLKAAA